MHQLCDGESGGDDDDGGGGDGCGGGGGGVRRHRRRGFCGGVDCNVDDVGVVFVSVGGGGITSESSTSSSFVWE
ncbi:unnamed protein product [Echinostoma caproni]|uniref:Uncharacterized protein n=1 Tax=Echinostoma caproni TaxID=27848 RepID=A0A183AIB7_9TREM|nr:unnamed protein product [Echinostoma caproni]